MEHMFHVTRAISMSSIERDGVLAEMSTGARDVSWWVDRNRIEWAIMHVCARYKLPPQDVWVCVAEFDENAPLKGTPLRGVYYTSIPCITIKAAIPAITLLENENAFDDWYQTVTIPF